MPHPTMTAALFAALTACLAAAPAPAQENAPARPVAPGGTWSFTFENDIVGGVDKDYTNGVRANYISPRNDLPFWARFAKRNLGWLTDADDWYATYGVGQNIYTPADITLETPAPGDRPYGGFLYGSIGVVADRGDRLDTIALDLGVVGPAAHSGEVQSFVHELINSPDPKGWDNQLRNEPAFRLLYERKYRYLYDFGFRLFDLETDAAPHYNIALGNVDTSAGLGLTVRLGDKLRDSYGPPRVRPAVAGPGFFDPSDGLGWHLFAGAEGRVVGRNIFIEGNTFRDDGPEGAEPMRLIGDLQAGVALQYNRVEITYTHVLRTPEYIGQDTLTQFGSVNVGVRF